MRVPLTTTGAVCGGCDSAAIAATAGAMPSRLCRIGRAIGPGRRRRSVMRGSLRTGLGGMGSNTPMENSQDIERRLLDLEVKASFADDLLEQLNQIIVRQQQQIDRLQREVADLRQQAPEGAVPFRKMCIRDRRDAGHPRRVVRAAQQPVPDRPLPQHHHRWRGVRLSLIHI